MSPSLFQAVTFNSSNDVSAPLISEESLPRPIIGAKVLNRFKSSSLTLGLLVGFFIQFSTLGANFLVISLWGEDVLTKSKRDVVMFSLLWSFFTSAMAIIILGFLRNLVTITYNAVQRQQESFLEEMVLHMECRFVVGALIGVCAAWTLTDVLLGMKAQILYSMITLVVALVWCRIMMWFFSEKEENKEEQTEHPLMIV